MHILRHAISSDCVTIRRASLGEIELEFYRGKSWSPKGGLGYTSFKNRGLTGLTLQLSPFPISIFHRA